ncbi:TRC40/GET3/ArsA family transport-energizing ATPase, partial [Tardiphaga sp.]|uniref:TRC40/GET3/ArsA family transport-energizing ATPase n=1 Tax=Tardiphaga sp. TaxID=1926292 RepID=UPI00352B2B80
MNDSSLTSVPQFLVEPTRFLFFTGKGGVGKTSIASVAALSLADRGKSILLVSTDPASNLDEILDVPLTNQPVAVPNAVGLDVLNIDPTIAAEAYRTRVLAQMEANASAQERDTVREQLSGACTTEIAAFDEFVGRLADADGTYDHIIFDTAPTGHTLRLLSLPKAWSGFLAENDQGASCLGPHSGLKTQEERFRKAMAALCDPAATTVILVTRPEQGAIAEAGRTSTELATLGLGNQHLVVNGLFRASDPSDATAASLEAQGREALAEMPVVLRKLPRDDIALCPFEMMGLDALRSVLCSGPLSGSRGGPAVAAPWVGDLPGLDRLIDLLAAD